MRKTSVLLLGLLFACSDAHDPSEGDAHVSIPGNEAATTHAGPDAAYAVERDAGYVDLDPPTQTSRDGAVAAHEEAGASTAVSCSNLDAGSDLGLGAISDALGVAYDRAWTHCIRQFGYVCGLFRLHFDARGCAAQLEADGASGDAITPEYEACLVSAMADTCHPCAAGANRRVFESCTLH